ncbi:conserved hypothetical protein [Burkholderia sp. 8Y]|nr:conserved hypothetical protein [Burkholderia sp. 8Y]
MDNRDVFVRLKERVERQIEQREAELIPFHEYVHSLETAGYDSTAARYVLGCMEHELAAWAEVYEGMNSFDPVVPVRARAQRVRT